MYLRFTNRSKYENLHLSTALEDWSMMEEFKQCTTIDQYSAGSDGKMDSYSVMCKRSLGETSDVSKEATMHEPSVKASLWLVVDPNIVLPYSMCRPLCPESPVTSPSQYSTAENVTVRTADDTTPEDSEEDHLTSGSEPYAEDDPCYVPIPAAAVVQRCHTRQKIRVQRRILQHNNWPRPPINYCNLISVALRNSEKGRLNVQQIYSFVREHFPFFRAAPDGWKNTVRHNLCFSSSFEKSSGWENADGGQRRSCLWKLTGQGRRKFRMEMRALPDELVHVLRKSMNRPGLMELMFGM
ncbi:forkhead box protein R1 [Hyperolius riggenbachi]|uniref:forkhead box protein R1 n=1 Tax=Hyperolius riggenbachi TaxID=752182 RepID=UPI0035A339CA